MTRIGNKNPRGGARHAERGAGLAVVLGVLAPIGVILGSYLLVLSSHHKEVEQRVALSSARNLSTSGVNHALTYLSMNPAFTGMYDVSLPGGAARITVADWTADGIDNDGVNGVDDVEEDGILEISSEGWVNPPFTALTDPLDGSAPSVGQGNGMRATRRYRAGTQVMARPEEIELPVDSAVYVDDAMAQLDIKGNAFLLDGTDVLMDGSPDPGGAVTPGIGVPGDPQLLINQLSGQQQGNVLGEAGSPSIIQEPAKDLTTSLSTLTGLASTVWTGPTAVDGFVLGDPNNPAVAYATGDLTMTGATKGWGILIVDGDFVVAGNFEWYGVIICNQAVTFKGGGGVKDLFGGLLCLGGFGYEIDLNGNMSVRYSSEAVDMAKTAAEAALDLEVLVWIAK